MNNIKDNKIYSAMLVTYKIGKHLESFMAIFEVYYNKYIYEMTLNM